MATQMIYDLVDPAELIDYVRAFDNEVLRPEGKIVLDELLPNRPIEDLEFRIRKGALLDVDVAEFRAWDTPARMIGRQGTTRINGSLAPISQQIPIGEEEMHRVRILQGGSNNPLINQIYDDAELMIRSVQARVELARGDLINDGKVTISENGLTLEADFGRAAAMSVTAATVWTNTAATILSELMGWMEDYVDQNGSEPGSLWMPRVRLGNFALNTEMRQYAASNGTTPTRINSQTIDSIFAAEGLPPIRIYDGQFRVNGVRTRVLPVDKCFFMPAPGEALGHTFYGPTAEAIKLAELGYIKASATPGVVAVVTSSDDPVQTFTKGAAVALPAMPNPDLIMDMDVAS